MVEFKIKVNPEQRSAYIPKELYEAFGKDLKILPNANAAILFSSNKSLDSVIKSVELLLEDLRLRLATVEISNNE